MSTFYGHKPRIYAENVSDYTNNGLGFLPDAQSCKVTEKLNGGLELEMQYPISGAGYEHIKINGIIYSPINPYDNWQPFRIYSISRPHSGIVKVNAEHKAYELSGYPCLPNDTYIETAGSCTQCLAYLQTEVARTAAAIIGTAYTFTTDIDTTATWSIESPTDIWSVMAQVAKWYNGEWKYDGTVCRLCAVRGEDRHVKVMYGSNLLSCTQDEVDTSYTHIMPYWTDGTTTVYINGYYMPATHFEPRMQRRVFILDLSSEFDSEPTSQQLIDAATVWANENKPKGIEKNLKCTFISRGQTIEYAALGDIDHVELGDTINVSDNPLQVNSTLRCISLVYDVLRGVYSSAELGVVKQSLATATMTVNERSEATVWVSTTEPTEGYHSGDYWIKIDSNVSRIAQALGRYTGGGWQLLCEYGSGTGKFLDAGHTSVAHNDREHNTSQGMYDSVDGYKNTLTGAGSISSDDVSNGCNTVTGQHNSLTDCTSNIVTGKRNTISGTYYSVIGGRDHNITNACDCAVFGEKNTVSYWTYRNIIAGIYNEIAGGDSSIVCGKGNYVTASQCIVCGQYGTAGYNTALYRLVIGDGSSVSSRSNALTVNGRGDIHTKGQLYPGGADWAETYEWLDGNPDNEDRRGLFVTLDGAYIKLATAKDDYILGAVSATPSVCGDTYDLHWKGKYKKDVFGTIQTDEEGKPILADDFDPELKYVPQSDRKEKAKVGTQGKIIVVDDGTCVVNKYCKPSANGIGTYTDDKNYYRVIERLDDTHIKIVIK